jgi:phage gp36-like protein
LTLTAGNEVGVLMQVFTVPLRHSTVSAQKCCATDTFLSEAAARSSAIAGKARKNLRSIFVILSAVRGGPFSFGLREDNGE